MGESTFAGQRRFPTDLARGRQEPGDHRDSITMENALVALPFSAALELYLGGKGVEIAKRNFERP